MYRVTHHVVQNLPLTSKQKFSFRLARPGQARPKRNFSFAVNRRFCTDKKTKKSCFSGGGSAGAVVANRLTEDPRWRVLLLEAGGDETEISDVPSLAAYLQLGSMDWKYKTEPQPGRACLGK